MSSGTDSPGITLLNTSGLAVAQIDANSEPGEGMLSM
jgi:hypothetical protein